MELVSLYAHKHDMNALGTLFKRYSHLVASIAIQILKNEDEAQDVAQEVFEIVARDLKRNEVANFNNWLFSVVKFHCFKVKKNKQSKLEDGEEKLAMITDDELDNYEKEMIFNRRVEVMQKGLVAIKDHQKKCLELFYLKGYSYEEVAAATGYSVKEVKSFIQNGKRNLKEFIIKNNG